MDEWHYEPVPDFDKTPAERIKDFPRHPNLLLYGARTLTNLAVRGILRSYHRLTITGRENLPQSESFIMVANHSSHLDAPVLLASLPLRQIHRAFPAAAADYFFTNLPAAAISAIVVNAMPFDRKENPKQSIDLCRQLLESPGHVLVLFPEGTRTVNGEIGAFKPGIGFLVGGSDIPIVPCYIGGAYEAWPKGAVIPRPGKVSLTIGNPLRFPDASRNKDDALAIASALRDAVISLGKTSTQSGWR